MRRSLSYSVPESQATKQRYCSDYTSTNTVPVLPSLPRTIAM
jgi:hypothetical protein